ncbi:EamA family transporter [Croceicoccus ponticola]|uniref:EamA family transporter n=1 Tax=Croceicoccus ponticola TaxID=2217664 RepID=A0A437GYY0_9SPHN|nr:DMT family transporter [Croceicoccus ponticola]RVQ66956.1 EamA family transporter [Croceicoccus ponticola]
MNETAVPRERLRFSDPRAFVPFVLVALIWGSTWLVIKDQISVVPPSWTIAYRFLVASVVIVLVLKVRGQRLRVSRRAWPVVIIVGVTQFVMNFHFVYRSEATLTSGIVALFFALIMIPNSLLARVVLGERVSKGFVFGSAIAIAGVALLLAQEYRAAGASDGVMLGVLFAILATVSASIANVTQATDRAHDEPFMPLLAASIIVGTLVNVVLALMLDGPPVWDSRPSYLGGIAYLGIIGSILTFPLYFMLIRNMGAGRAAYIAVATPILAMLLSSLFEGYDWTPLAVGGSLLSLTGLVIALKARH